MNLLSFKKISAVYIFLFSFFFSSQLLAATTTFSFTGSNQTFTVPAGVTSITMEGFGAAGGAGEGCANSGGKGGYLKSTITVTANDTLTIVVGEKGDAGAIFGGGGEGGSGGMHGGGSGGGATHVKNSSGTTLFVIGAGGGGGGRLDCGAGGDGGGATGQNGVTIFNPAGTGGSQVAGGIGFGEGSSNGASLAGGNGGDFGMNVNEGGGGGGGAGFFGGGGGGSGEVME